METEHLDSLCGTLGMVANGRYTVSIERSPLYTGDDINEPLFNCLMTSHPEFLHEGSRQDIFEALLCFSGEELCISPSLHTSKISSFEC